MTSLAHSLASRIASHIRSEGLRSGDRLTERKLAEQFRVSRSPVRAAMKRLEEAGVLVAGERSGYQVVDVEAAARIFGRANMYLFTASTTFQQARFATAQAAEDIYGRCSREWTTIHMAWDTVGVGGKWGRCPAPPRGF